MAWFASGHGEQRLGRLSYSSKAIAGLADAGPSHCCIAPRPIEVRGGVVVAGAGTVAPVLLGDGPIAAKKKTAVNHRPHTRSDVTHVGLGADM